MAARKSHSKKRRRILSRRTIFECLEDRRMLVGEWQNTNVTTDVDASGSTGLLDAFILIDDLRTNGVGHALPAPTPGNSPPPFFDVNANDKSDLVDIFMVIAALRDDITAPTIEAALANDTGAVGDMLTADPVIAGVAKDNETGIGALSAEIDGGAPVAVDVQPNGQFQFDPDFAVDGSDDGSHTIRFTATNGFPNIPTTFELTFTLDTTAPPQPTFDLDAASDTAPVGDRSTSLSRVTIVGQTSPNTFVSLAETGSAAVSDAQGEFEFSEIDLFNGQNNFTVLARDQAGNESSLASSIHRIQAQPDFDIFLSEGSGFHTEANGLVELGGLDGARFLTFDVFPSFDISDAASASEDVLLVSLVDAADVNVPILQRGAPGSALFSLAGTQADYPAGLVRFDGRTVTIDVTELDSLTNGRLRFQLISTDIDQGTSIGISNIASTFDPDSNAGPELSRNVAVAAPGAALNLAPYAPSPQLQVLVENVRFNTATNRYQAEIRVRNTGSALSREVAVVLPNLPPPVSLVSPSGFDANGDAYLNLRDAIPSGGLGPNATSAPTLLEIDNANLDWFQLTATPLAVGPNQPPQLTTVGPLHAVIGARTEVALIASDADGDALYFSISGGDPLPGGSLSAAGVLRFEPTPGDEGLHNFSVIVSDGVLSTSQDITLTVANGTGGTRISGQVLDTSGAPLADVPVEIDAGSYVAAVLGDSPAGFWRLGETVGPTAVDSSILAHDGVYANGVQLAQPGALVGDADTAADFDGADDEVQIADTAAHRTSHFTLEAWLKPAVDSPDFGTAISKTSNDTWTDGFGLYESSTEGLTFFVNDWNTTFVNAPIAADVWTHVAASYDGSFLRLFMNGEIVDSLAFSAAVNHSTAALQLGTAPGDWNWKGGLDEIAFYGQALDSAQIRAHYQIGMGDDSVTTLTDSQGRFTLAAVGGGGDALRVRGEQFVGSNTYPFIAEKLELMYDHPLFPGVDNIIHRPIYLPALDVANAVTIDPNEDTYVTTPNIPGAQLEVFAESLYDTEGTLYSGSVHITEVPPDLTPAALPANMFPDLVVTIQPGEMEFTEPAPLTLPNRSGLAPFTQMDLWSINPVTGRFDNVGFGEVSFDGSVIETLEGGVASSSWHFWAPPIPSTTPDPPADELKRRRGGGGSGGLGCGLSPAGPGGAAAGGQPLTHGTLHEFPDAVAANGAPISPKTPCQRPQPESPLDAGNLLLPVPLFSYQSYGAIRGATLEYDSLRADPRPIIGFAVENVGQAGSNDRLVAKAAIGQGNFQVQAPGNIGGTPGLTGGEQFWKTPAGTQSVRAGLQVDLSHQPSGVFDYTLDAGIRTLAGGAVTGTMSQSVGRMTSVNSMASVFGVGWGLNGLEEIVVNEDGSVLVINGNGSEELFDNEGGQLQSPKGLHVSLEDQGDGTFLKTTADRTRFEYGQNGMLSKVTHRTGHETSYVYDAFKRLIKVVDPAGLETLLIYNGSLVEELIDPAGRRTLLEHDADGQLLKVTYADGGESTFTYAARGLLASVTDPEGEEYRFEYDSFGRLSDVIAPDDGRTQFAPGRTNGLVAGESENPIEAGTALAGFDLVALDADSRGNVTQTKYAASGAQIIAVDSVGLIGSIQRDSQKQVVQSIDARGHVTQFVYDPFGNLIEQRDEISAAPFRTLQVFEDQLLGPVDDLEHLGRVGKTVVGDIDGDGLQDAVSIHQDTNPDFVAVYRGRPNGRLSDPERIEMALGEFLTDVQLVDVDRDDNLDLLIYIGAVNFGAVGVMLNDGAGFFGTRVDHRVGDGVGAIVAADINNDSNVDLLTNNAESQQFSVLLGDGAGGFAPALIAAAPARPLSVALGRLDGGPNVDMFMTTENPDLNNYVFLGNGDGTFAAPQVVAANRRTGSLRLAELNGDGHLDAITGGTLVGLSSPGVGILFGRGDGTFDAPLDTPTEGIASVEVGDVDDDGDNDIVVGMQSAPTGLLTLVNDAGDFTTTSVAISNPFIRSLTLADMDGDSKLDAVTTHFSGRDEHGVAIQFGDGAGAFGARMQTNGFVTLGEPALGDVNGDGFADVVVATDNGASPPYELQAFISDGSGGISSTLQTSIDRFGNVELIDVDGDDDLDVVVFMLRGNTNGETSFEVRLNDGSGNFGAAIPHGLGVLDALLSYAIADIDGDDDVDILIGREVRATPAGPITSGPVGIFENVGGGSFVKFVDVDVQGVAKSVSIADVDVDGVADIAAIVQPIGGGPRMLAIARGLGSDVFEAPAFVDVQFGVGAFNNPISVGQSLLFFDANLDGAADIAATTDDRGVAILLNDGDGDFGFNQRIDGINGDDLIAADFDKNGALDLLVGANTDSVSANYRYDILVNEGDGDFVERVAYLAGGDVNGIAVGDINNDSYPDIAVSDIEPLSNKRVLTRINQLGDRPPSRQPARYAYDPVFNRVTSITDELGRQTVFTLDPATGNRTTARQIVGAPGGADDLLTSYTYTHTGLVETATDPLGRVTRFTYDDFCRMTGVTFAEGTPDAASRSFTYDSAGNVLAFTDENGNVTTYEYDLMNRLVRTTYPDPDGAGPLLSPVFVEAYDQVGNRTSDTDAEGNVTQYEYDSAHRLISLVDPGGAESTFEYDDAGNMIRIVDPLGRSTQFFYDARNRLTVTVDPLDGVLLQQWDRDDNLVAVTNKLGRTTEMQYDARNRRVRVIDAAGGVQTVTYDASDNVTARTDINGNVTRYEYDDLGRRVNSIDALGGQYPNVYDAAGNLIVWQDPLGRATQSFYDARNRLVRHVDPLGIETTWRYDAAGSVLSVTNPLGRQHSYEYDALHRITKVVDPLGGESTYGYDGNDNQIRATDQAGRTTLYEYDALQQITRITDPLGASQQYTYDALSNQIGVTDELGRTWSFSYDALGRPIRRIDPLLGVESTTYDASDNVVASTDALGRTTTYSYDGLNRLTVVTDPLGGQNHRAYDGLGNVISTTDELGNSYAFEYDALNRLTKAIDPSGEQIETVLDGVGNVLRTTDELGRSTQFAYDALNRLILVRNALGDDATFQYDNASNRTSVTDPLGRTTTWQYDGLDRVTREVDALGGTREFSYDPVGNLLSHSDALGRSTSYQYDARDRLVQVTDALGEQSRWEWDAVGNLVTQVDALGRETKYLHDGLDRIIGVVDAVGNTASVQFDAVGNTLAATDALGRTRTNIYDGLNRPVRVIDPNGDAVEYEYDLAGRTTAVIDPLGQRTEYQYDGLSRLIETTDALGEVSSFVYDEVGNLRSSIDVLGRATQYEYDDLDRRTLMTDPLGNSEESTYDEVGNLLSVSNELNHTTTHSYDALNRLVSMVDALGDATTYSYDAVGNVLQVIDPLGNATAFTYDDVDRRTSSTDALGGVQSYEYDAIGNLRRRTDRNARVVEFAYDDLDRRTAEIWFDDQNQALNTVAYQYDAAGQLTGAGDAFSNYAMTYDGVGRLASTDNNNTVNSPRVVFEYAYDARSQRTSRSETVDGQLHATTTWEYDALSRTTSIAQSGPFVEEKRIDLLYDAFGQTSQANRFADLARTLPVAATNYSFDAAGRLTDIDHSTSSAGVLAAYDFVFDDIGRITQATSPDGVVDYAYDARNQLLSANHSAQTDESYSYDANGNRNDTGFQTAADNRLTSDGQFNYEYDAEGNRTRRVDVATGDETEYQWDHRNRLTRVTDFSSGGIILADFEFIYDVFDNRIVKNSDTDGDGPEPAQIEAMVYDGDAMVLSFDESETLTHRYLNGPGVDQVFADENALGEVLWPLADHLQTVRHLVDSSGNVENQISYDSYGEVVAETNPQVDYRFGFNGRDRDETGLSYFRARYYDPAVGRFVSQDPIEFAGGDANLYRYVGNTPTSQRDPSGLAMAVEYGGAAAAYMAIARALAQMQQHPNVPPNQPPVEPIDVRPSESPSEAERAKHKLKCEKDERRERERRAQLKSMVPRLAPLNPYSGNGGSPLPLQGAVQLEALAASAARAVLAGARKKVSLELSKMAGRMDELSKITLNGVAEISFYGENVNHTVLTLLGGLTYYGLPGKEQATRDYIERSKHLTKEWGKRGDALVNFIPNSLQAMEAFYDEYRKSLKDPRSRAYFEGKVETKIAATVASLLSGKAKGIFDVRKGKGAVLSGKVKVSTTKTKTSFASQADISITKSTISKIGDHWEAEAMLGTKHRRRTLSKLRREVDRGTVVIDYLKTEITDEVEDVMWGAYDWSTNKITLNRFAFDEFLRGTITEKQLEYLYTKVYVHEAGHRSLTRLIHPSLRPILANPKNPVVLGVQEMWAQSRLLKWLDTPRLQLLKESIEFPFVNGYFDKLDP